MRVRVDQETCQGYLLCVNHVPQVFDEDEVGKGIAIEGDVPGELEAEVRVAIEECPVQAILARGRE